MMCQADLALTPGVDANHEGCVLSQLLPASTPFTRLAEMKFVRCRPHSYAVVMTDPTSARRYMRIKDIESWRNNRVAKKIQGSRKPTCGVVLLSRLAFFHLAGVSL